MRSTTANPSLFLHFAIVCALLLSAADGSGRAQAPPADTPVGHWVAEHISHSGIGSWWDFRPDGTLTMHLGAIVTSPITRSGDTFTSPPVTVNGPPIKVTYHVDGDTLHLQSADTPDQILSRIGPAPSAADPLLGKWKPVPPATPSTDPKIAAQQTLMINATLVFSADNTESIRVPFTAQEGTWDATAHTFRLANQTATFSFQRTGSKLTLGQPPDNHKTDTYIPDPIL
jgi:hypothetical protein